MKYKKITGFSLVFVLFFICLSSLFYSCVSLEINNIEQSMYHSCKSDDGMYHPNAITPENVSYHPSLDSFSLEWWYFEGIFDNGYNAVVNNILLSKNNIGVCITHLNIFHIDRPTDSFAKRIYTPFIFFNGSQQYPDIFVHGNQIIDFDEDAYLEDQQWRYHLTVDIEEYAVDLTFVGLSPGWEGETIGGMYGPVLPMASVNGTLFVDHEEVTVSGLGYHEHAQGITFPVREWGWYWGKIVGETSSLFWGKMMNTRWDEQARAGVFSVINESFTNIAPTNIEMMLTEYEFHCRRFIPTLFSYTILDDEQDIYIDVTMETVHVYHLPLGFFNYWRYIIKINGVITYQGVREELHDEPQIMELMRFR